MCICNNLSNDMTLVAQPHSQGLSSLPPLVVGTETLAAAGPMTTQILGGRKICWKGGATGFFTVTEANVLEYPLPLQFSMDRWSRDQPQTGSLFQRLREAEERDPGNEVASHQTEHHTLFLKDFFLYSNPKTIKSLFVFDFSFASSFNDFCYL